MKQIGEFLKTEVKGIREDTPTKQYRVRTTSLEGNIEIEKYLRKYPLFGAKYLDSQDWMEVLETFKNKVSLKTKVEVAQRCRAQMNDQRKEYN